MSDAGENRDKEATRSPGREPNGEVCCVAAVASSGGGAQPGCGVQGGSEGGHKPGDVGTAEQREENKLAGKAQGPLIG